MDRTTLIAIPATALATAAAVVGVLHLTGGDRIKAESFISADDGGTVRTSDGASLRIPPNTLEEDGKARITEGANGRYDVHIDPNWKGSVKVALPEAADSGIVLHEVDGDLIAESDWVGQPEVTVSSLSWFDVVKCPLQHGTAVLDCLKDKGATAVRTSFLVSIGKKLTGSCAGAGTPVALLTVPLQLALNPDCSQKLDNGDLDDATLAKNAEYARNHPESDIPVGDDHGLGQLDPDTQPGPLQGGSIGQQLQGDSGGGSSQQIGSGAQPPVESSLAATWSETVGGPTHTWTNPQNAGGSEGPTIQTGQAVQIACRLQGMAVANGNTWWYRIASPPWAGSFYASADAFYNNGSTSGPLKGTPWVDEAVAGC